MKLEDLSTAELKALGFDQFVRRARAQQESDEATKAINAIMAVLEERSMQQQATAASAS